MYSDPDAWDELMRRITRVLAHYAAEQASAGADALQVFDSWVGSLSPMDYNRFVLPHTKALIGELKATGAPVIYFGTDTATLLPAIKQTRAEVIGIRVGGARVDLSFVQSGGATAVQVTRKDGDLDIVVRY